ncbi:MAG: M48 family metallopeptidase [Verrucomicrobiae bacterium]|nr:M48 family metallopeptidase [Verrucomicrobiae bacterium]
MANDLHENSAQLSAPASSPVQTATAGGDARAARAKRYERIKLRLHLGETAFVIVALAAFYFTGGSRALAAFARDIGRNEWGTVAVYVAALLTTATVATLPLSWWGGFRLEHRFNLSNQTLGAWAWDELKSFGLSLALMTVVGEVIYAFLRAAGAWWWLWAAAFMTALTLLLSFILPVVIIPIFYKLTRLEDEPLAARLRAMAERSGARVVGVFRIGLGAKTRKANAAFAGFGRTRRILLGDTLLANFSGPEIEVVLAHELAHYRHHDIWKGMAVSAALTTAGLWLSDRLLRAAVGGDLANVEHLPLLALALALFALVVSPATNAWSRRAEYRADRAALELTRDPDAFTSAMRKLAGQNLADMEPHPLVEFLFHDHPALAKRIAKAAAWRQSASV